MNNVVGHLVLAPGNEDLRSGNPVVVALWHGASLESANIRTGVRLCHVHGAGPLTADHFRQVCLLLRLCSVMDQKVDSAMGEHRAQTERKI